VIIKDKIKLQEKCSPVSVKEGEEIGVRLLHELRQSDNGIGLAANQIGIDKRVCVINVKEPLVLINPKIVKHSKEQFVFPEGCLSFPDSKVKTKRYESIVVEADNHKGRLSFSANSKDINDAFECVCVQHEIDHLDGITMFDREFRQEPMVRGENAPLKIGRNEKVTLTKGSKSKTLKYKKAESLMEDGWVLAK
jgi:peptide deformylase|tara:strand:- start:87 stop:668 length:582 start_codon:yes stop_codon:yes gene_type:complete